MKSLQRLLVCASMCGVALGCSRAEQATPIPVEPAPPVTAAPVAVTLLPATGPSLYELDLDLVDQDGKQLTLDAFSGRPVIVTMFYASCPVACPMLISDIKSAVKQASPQTQAELAVILVSFDPERDTPDKLKELARLHRLDKPSWRFTRTSAESTRELAAVLGIKYRTLEGGAIRHTSLISVLDRRGVVRHRATSPISSDDTSVPRALDAVRRPPAVVETCAGC